MATFRQLSKQDFTPKETNLESLNTGSLQRIADATELMAKNFIAMQNDLDYYKRRYNECRGREDKLYRQISALKGVITKLKKKDLKPSIID